MYPNLNCQIPQIGVDKSTGKRTGRRKRGPPTHYSEIHNLADLGTPRKRWRCNLSTSSIDAHTRNKRTTKRGHQETYGLRKEDEVGELRWVYQRLIRRQGRAREDRSDFGHTGGSDRVVNGETDNHQSTTPLARSPCPCPSSVRFLPPCSCDAPSSAYWTVAASRLRSREETSDMCASVYPHKKKDAGSENDSQNLERILVNYNIWMGSRSLPVPRKNLQLPVKVPVGGLVPAPGGDLGKPLASGASSPTCHCHTHIQSLIQSSSSSSHSHRRWRARSGRTNQERNKTATMRTNQPRGAGDLETLAWRHGAQVFPIDRLLGMEWVDHWMGRGHNTIICLCRFAFATARNQNDFFFSHVATSKYVLLHLNVLGFWHVRHWRRAMKQTISNHCPYEWNEMQMLPNYTPSVH